MKNENSSLPLERIKPSLDRQSLQFFRPVKIRVFAGRAHSQSDDAVAVRHKAEILNSEANLKEHAVVYMMADKN